MSKKTARVPGFSHLSGKIKTWYKAYTARRNRKKLRQARDIESHIDRPLDVRAID